MATQLRLGAPEIDRRVRHLETYCSEHATTPSTLIAGWEQRLDITGR